MTEVSEIQGWYPPVAHLGPWSHTEDSPVEVVARPGYAYNVRLGDWLDYHRASPYVCIKGWRGHTILDFPLHLTGPCPTIEDIQVPQLVLENPHTCRLDVRIKSQQKGVFGLLIETNESGAPPSAPNPNWPAWDEDGPYGAKHSRSRIHVEITGPGDGFAFINHVTDEMKSEWEEELGGPVNTYHNHARVSGQVAESDRAGYLEGVRRMRFENFHVDAIIGKGVTIGPRCAHIDWHRGPGYIEPYAKGTGIPVIDGETDKVRFLGWEETEVNQALYGQKEAP